MGEERLWRFVLEAAETIIQDAARDAVRFQRGHQGEALVAHVAYVLFVRVYFDAVLRMGVWWMGGGGEKTSGSLITDDDGHQWGGEVNGRLLVSTVSAN